MVAKLVDKIDDVFYVVADDQTDAEIAVIDHLKERLDEESEKAGEQLEIVVNYKFLDDCGNHRVQGYYQ